MRALLRGGKTIANISIDDEIIANITEIDDEIIANITEDDEVIEILQVLPSTSLTVMI